MKIALCNVQEFNPLIGGIERVSVSLATSLVEAGIDVYLISCRKSLYSKEYTLPMPQYYLPEDSDYSQRNIDEMCHIIQKLGVEIVVNQNAHSLLFHKQCIEVCRITNTKLVSVLHFNPDMREKAYKNMIDWHFFTLSENVKHMLFAFLLSYPCKYITLYDHHSLYKSLYKDSNKTVLLSQNFFRSFCRIAHINSTNKLSAIPNMLSFEYKDENVIKENIILFCGRMVEQKNPYRALYVWKSLQDKLPTWKMQFVGDGPLLERLKKLSTKLNLERIEFLGFQEPVSYFKKAKIFLLTSNYEGWALTLTEAMQYRCVPVAFNSYESITDIITDAKSGYLIKPFDIKAMATKVQEIAINESLYYKLANTGFKDMLKYRKNKVVNQWIKLFNEL